MNTGVAVVQRGQVPGSGRVAGAGTPGPGTEGDRRDLAAVVPGWSLWRLAAVRGAGLPFDLVDGPAMPRLLERPAGAQRDNELRAAADKQVAATALDDTFRTALAWQNPRVLEDWLGDYARRPADDPDAPLSRRGYQESVLVRYAKRYCTKNESIGFFGPAGRARLSGRPGGLNVGAGIRRSTPYPEPWSVAATAAACREDPRLFAHLPVRLNPAGTVAQGVLRVPRRPARTCDGITGALLAAIDGRRPCGEVPAVAAAALPETCQEGELRAELLRLDRPGLIQLGFRVPHDDRPEAAATRRATYSRTPAYLDCRRNTDVPIGKDLLESPRRPLGFLLDSARWLAARVGEVMAEGLRERHSRLLRRRGEDTLADLQFAAGDILSGATPELAAIQDQVQRRWARLLLPVADQEEIRVDCAQVAPAAAELFSPPERLWWAASRRHSPDLMLSLAPDMSLRWVLGELHVALNAMESRLFRTQCDEPGEMIAATAADMRQGHVVSVPPLDAPETIGRTHPPSALDPAGLYRSGAYDADQGHPSRVSCAPAAGVLVQEREGELIVEARTEGWSAPVLEFFGDFATAVAVNLFKLRPSAPYQPRLLPDDVVVARRSWSMAAEVPFTPWKSADRPFAPLREWAAGLGVPRWSFERTPGERKPVYLDLAAPLLISDFVRAVRKAADWQSDPCTVEIIEMLRRPDHLWLRDASGRPYTAKFREVAVDDHEPALVVRDVRPATPTRRGRT
ncbi:lantibiotic dehydratase [Streptomyces mesophilus]|uniref:lantibiotic dehydratase n=1 Tax=Streptomyces mesophilus TaxID=1775132 RepID=UPI00331C3549